MFAVPAGSIISKVFKQELIEAVTYPKMGKEMIVDRGKIEEITHKKIQRGDLIEFQRKQDPW